MFSPRHFFFTLALLILAVLVLYYSWIPTPTFKEEAYMPAWLIWFTDAFDNFRTAVPLLMMGLLAGAWLMIAKVNWFFYGLVLAAMILLVTVAELGQLMLPKRSFDWADIAWGSIGAAVGLAISFLLGQLFKKRTQPEIFQ